MNIVLRWNLLWNIIEKSFVECWVNACIPAQRQRVTGLIYVVDGTVLQPLGAQYLTHTVLSKLKQLMLYAKETQERRQFSVYE